MHKTDQRATIWTIGHSTHSLETFLEMLHSCKIDLLVDVRNFPGSAKFPHFNKDHIEKAMPANGIEYLHMKALGGRRKPAQDSVNTRWRNNSFRAYADYTQTDDFKEALQELERLASLKRIAYMCSEAVWWRCHRSIISDKLKIRGWEVLHIMGIGKTSEHPFTSAARIEEGKLFYSDKNLFD